MQAVKSPSATCRRLIVRLRRAAEKPADFNESGWLGLGQGLEANHLSHNLEARDQGKDQSSALDRQVSAQGGGHLIAGTHDPDDLAELARGRLRKKP